MCQGRRVSESQPESAPESLRDRTFRDRSLKDSRFVSCDLSGVVVRGSLVADMELDSPWLIESGGRLLVNGVDVVPMVDAELNRRFPGRQLRLAIDPAGLRSAWAAIEQTWAATLEEAQAMPPGTVDVSVDQEWSVAQTLRHLVMATDTWLGRAILGLEHPYHPAGLQNDDGDSAAFSASDFSADDPTFAEVLDARASRQAMVRDYLADVTPEVLTRVPQESRTRPSTTRPCSRASTRSSRRSGSTTATPTATSTPSARQAPPSATNDRLEQHRSVHCGMDDGGPGHARRLAGRRHGGHGGGGAAVVVLWNWSVPS